MKFTKEFNVRWHDTNANREITPSAILTLMQETTNGHIKTMYPSIEYVRDELHQAFILSKIYMRFYGTAHAYDDVTVETWTGEESRGYTFYRSFRVIREGEVIADALTVWALLDTETHKLLPVKCFENTFVDEPSIDISIPRRIKFPECEPEFTAKRKTLYGDIDYNKHMNNTHYPNMLVDYLPSPERLRVSEMILSFVRGELYGSEITLERRGANDEFFFRTLNESGEVCLEAVVRTEKRTDEIK